MDPVIKIGVTLCVCSPFSRRVVGHLTDAGQAVHQSGHSAHRHIVDLTRLLRRGRYLSGSSGDGRCQIGLLEEGRFDADLRLRTAYGVEKSYALDPVLYIRQEPLEPAAGGDRTLLLAEVEGDWRAAAKWYRRYNLEVRKLPTIAERVRTEPNLAYSTRSLTIRCRMAVKPLPTQILVQRPENEPAPRVFLTFDNVREIAEEFARQGSGRRSSASSDGTMADTTAPFRSCSRWQTGAEVRMICAG